VLRPLEDPTSEPSHHYEYRGDHTRGQIHLDGRRLPSAASVPGAVARLISHINASAALSWPGLTIHGAAVADHDGRAVLVVGPSGAGKSSLTAGLLTNGYGYLTDEVIALDDTLTTVTAYPRSISLKPGPFDLDAGAVPPDQFEAFSTDQRFIDPTTIGRGWVLETARVELLVVLAGSAVDGGALEVSIPSRAVFLRDLVAQMFAFRTSIGRPILEALGDFLAWCPHVQLRGGTPMQRQAFVVDQLGLPHSGARPAVTARTGHADE
jgi:hypothetical protein